MRNRRICENGNNILYMSGYPWIQKKINELNISQAEAARQCGIDPIYFNKMIKGREKRGMYAFEAVAISKALSMPIEEVITGKKQDGDNSFS
jgi:hypothetical protein